MKISRFACARAQHVISGMPVAMNTRKACCIGYFIVKMGILTCRYGFRVLETRRVFNPYVLTGET